MEFCFTFISILIFAYISKKSIDLYNSLLEYKEKWKRKRHLAKTWDLIKEAMGEIK